MIIEIKKKGDYIDFTELVGKESSVVDKKTLIHKWDNDRKELGIIINDENNIQIGAEIVSLAFGLVVFMEKVSSYGFEVIVTDGISYSSETKQKAAGLTLAGFYKMIKKDENYMVDNIFQQNILLESELQYLLENNILEINLSEIK